MSPTKDPKDRSILWMRVFFVLLIVGGLIFIGCFHGEFVHSLGHALIVAGILGLTVDYYVKRHLVKEAARDIDKYLLGYALPPELQEKIREVRETKVVRRNFVCTYTISPSDSEKKIKLEAHLTFEVENITSGLQDYTQELALDEHNSPVIALMCCETNDKSQKYCLEGSALAKQIAEFTKANPGAATVEVSAKKVELQPKSRYSYLNYKFHARYSQTCPEIGSEYFRFDQPYIPTIGVSIVVNHPKGFAINFPPERKPEKVEPGKAEWSDSKVFLRGEIITIWWRPEEIAARMK